MDSRGESNIIRVCEFPEIIYSLAVSMHRFRKSEISRILYILACTLGKVSIVSEIFREYFHNSLGAI
jgi:hypothetical protein